LRDRRIGLGRDGVGDSGPGADVLDVVGDQQRRVQQLPRLGEAAKRTCRIVRTPVDLGGDRPEMLLLAVAAGDVVAAAGDLVVDIGLQPASVSSSRSIWPIAVSTLARSD
jgi:hypothetical protein